MHVSLNPLAVNSTVDSRLFASRHASPEVSRASRHSAGERADWRTAWNTAYLPLDKMGFSQKFIQ